MRVSMPGGSDVIRIAGERTKEQTEQLDDARSHLLGLVAGNVLAELVPIYDAKFIQRVVAESHDTVTVESSTLRSKTGRVGESANSPFRHGDNLG